MTSTRARVGGAALVLALSCHPPEPPLRWVDDSTFTAPRSSFIDEIRRSVGSDEYASLRIAAALEHNCPLEDVTVAAEQRMASAEPRFVLRVCGEEHTYLELEGPVFVEVLPPRAPTGPDTAAPPTTPPSATDPKPMEPKQ